MCNELTSAHFSAHFFFDAHSPKTTLFHSTRSTYGISCTPCTGKPLPTHYCSARYGYPDFGDEVSTCSRIGVRISQASHQASLAEQRFEAYEKGKCYWSQRFSLSGVDGLSLAFYPKGYTSSKENKCALYLQLPRESQESSGLRPIRIWRK